MSGALELPPPERAAVVALLQTHSRPTRACQFLKASAEYLLLMVLEYVCVALIRRAANSRYKGHSSLRTAPDAVLQAQLISVLCQLLKAAVPDLADPESPSFQKDYWWGEVRSLLREVLSDQAPGLPVARALLGAELCPPGVAPTSAGLRALAALLNTQALAAEGLLGALRRHVLSSATLPRLSSVPAAALIARAVAKSAAASASGAARTGGKAAGAPSACASRAGRASAEGAELAEGGSGARGEPDAHQLSEAGAAPDAPPGTVPAAATGAAAAAEAVPEPAGAEPMPDTEGSAEEGGCVARQMEVGLEGRAEADAEEAEPEHEAEPELEQEQEQEQEPEPEQELEPEAEAEQEAEPTPEREAEPEPEPEHEPVAEPLAASDIALEGGGQERKSKRGGRGGGRAAKRAKLVSDEHCRRCQGAYSDESPAASRRPVEAAASRQRV